VIAGGKENAEEKKGKGETESQKGGVKIDK